MIPETSHNIGCKMTQNTDGTINILAGTTRIARLRRYEMLNQEQCDTLSGLVQRLAWLIEKRAPKLMQEADYQEAKQFIRTAIGEEVSDG